MFGLKRFYLWMRALFGKQYLEAEMDEELRFHLERQIEDNVKKGMSPQEARRATLLRFGGLAQIKEECRDQQGTRFVEDLWQDLCYGIRMMRRGPAFTAVAVLTLALGIGANTAIFTLVDAVLLRMLPVEKPSELVVLSQRVESRQVLPFAAFHYEGLQEARDVLAGLCAFRPSPGFVADINGEAELATGQLVSGNYYSVLGVNALAGRTITDDDDKAPGQNPVAVISYDYWQNRFAGDPGVMGRSIALQGQPFTIVGVTPRDFFGTEPGRAVQITVPLAMRQVIIPGRMLASRNARWLMLIGRLRSGVSDEQARASLNVLWAQLLAAEPQRGDRHPPVLDLESGSRGLNGLRQRFSLPLRILMAAVGLVLLIACANLAGLLSARSMARSQEIGVRLALGAGRGRVVRQLLTESILLALIGGAAGVALASWLTDLMVAIMSRGTAPIVLGLEPDLRSLAFTGAVSILTGLLFGLLPALRVTQGEIHSDLKGSAPGVVGRKNRWADNMVVFQVAFCLLLLSGAALFVRTLQHLHEVDAGFRKDHVLLLNVRPGASGYRGNRATAIYAELQERLRSLPGVQNVTLTLDTPLGGLNSLSYAQGISVPGRPQLSDEDSQVYFNFVGSRFFETLGIPLLSGRGFDDRDQEKSVPIAVINESLARHFFPNENPLGRHVLIEGKPVEIVGVAKDSRYLTLREPAHRMIYRPHSAGSGEMTICIRIAGDPESVIPLVRREVRAVAQNLPIYSLYTLEERVDGTLAKERILATLSSSVGLLAVTLAAIGLYGTLAFAVVQRTREIGLRMALGAKPGDVLWLVLGEALRLVFAGLAIGVPAAWMAARLSTNLVSGIVFKVKPTDPLAIVMAALLLFAVAVVAGYLPARRASRVDPMVALRYE